MKFTALVAIIEDKDEEAAIDVAKEAGAGGVTILHGKNIGIEEKKVFFGLTLEENVSVLLFLLPRKLSMKVMKAIRTKFDLSATDTPTPLHPHNSPPPNNLSTTSILLA